MLDVFITIDTEVWLDGLTQDPLEAINRRIYGHTPNGEFGIRYQMETLNAHGLKATFFVDPFGFLALNAEKQLREITGEIEKAGHEIQLHIHTEWLSKIPNPALPDQAKQHQKYYSEEEQEAIIAEGLNALQPYCKGKIVAFRAGNFGADPGTLRALAKNGLLFDSSYNAASGQCGIKLGEPLLQPKKMEGIYEFPVTLFRDFPKHLRPLQICGCSSWEMETVLTEAAEKGWHSAVIVSHSFELLRRPFKKIDRENQTVVRRFEKLCGFLSVRPDKFRTRLFSEVEPGSIPDIEAAVIRSNTLRTAARILEQLLS